MTIIILKFWLVSSCCTAMLLCLTLCGAIVFISLLSFFGFDAAGLVGLMNKNMVSSLISKYAQVVLWFCRTGLLPEGSGIFCLLGSCICFFFSVANTKDVIKIFLILRFFSPKCCSDTMTSLYSFLACQLDDDVLQISRPYYSQPAISNYYTIRREELTRLAK